MNGPAQLADSLATRLAGRLRAPRWRQAARALLAACACAAVAAPADAAPIPAGNGQQRIRIDGIALPVFTYRPRRCTPRLLLLVFHGVGRDGGGYRNHARPLARRICALVVAPQFDRARFPRALYQYGGVTSTTRPRTVDLIPALVRWSRAAAGRPALPYALLGHSGGAQFADRVAAYAPVPAVRYVIANPSTWVWPDTTQPPPFGFAGPGSAATASDTLRAYLAQPVTVLLGTADTRTRELAQSPAARAQGASRLARGRNVFEAAQKEARRHGWRFGWKLIEVPGVGHDAAAMFRSPEAREALGLDDPP